MPSRLAYLLRLSSLEKIGDLSPTGSTKHTTRPRLEFFSLALLFHRHHARFAFTKRVKSPAGRSGVSRAVLVLGYLVAGTGNPCALHARTTLMPSRLEYAVLLRSLEKIGDLNPTGSTKKNTGNLTIGKQVERTNERTQRCHPCLLSSRLTTCNWIADRNERPETVCNDSSLFLSN